MKKNTNRGDIIKILRGLGTIEGAINHEMIQEYFDHKRIESIIHKVMTFVQTLDKNWSHEEYGCSWKQEGIHDITNSGCICNGEEWYPGKKEWE